MSFDVSGDAYGRFMGRFSEPLAARFVELIDAHEGQSALDVGCGPGALTRELVDRLGVPSVAAIDPSESFVETVRERFPGIDVRRGVAEELPYPDHRFDLVLAQLVVHFMSDRIAAVAEMARVARANGTVAACVWDHGGDRGPLTTFWQAVRDLDPDASDESSLPGTHEGDLIRLFEQAGFAEVEPATLTIRVDFSSFDDWWEPFTLGVGPAGEYVAHLDTTRRDDLKARCAELLPTGPFALDASAWTAIGRVQES
ncbi:MAG: Methyltransferase type 11 [Glaciihabitans sp.]|nr:Methyltransferase type 11 [Glaciihabitans sp.]